MLTLVIKSEPPAKIIKMLGDGVNLVMSNKRNSCRLPGAQGQEGHQPAELNQSLRGILFPHVQAGN
ncbi:hypothetical protein ALT1644_570009 [Alteromonas macleodii]